MTVKVASTKFIAVTAMSVNRAATAMMRLENQEAIVSSARIK
jgi:hypothetical protein